MVGYGDAAGERWDQDRRFASRDALIHETAMGSDQDADALAIRLVDSLPHGFGD